MVQVEHMHIFKPTKSFSKHATVMTVLNTKQKRYSLIILHWYNAQSSTPGHIVISQLKELDVLKRDSNGDYCRSQKHHCRP